MKRLGGRGSKGREGPYPSNGEGVCQRHGIVLRPLTGVTDVALLPCLVPREEVGGLCDHDLSPYGRG